MGRAAVTQQAPKKKRMEHRDQCHESPIQNKNSPSLQPLFQTLKVRTGKGLLTSEPIQQLHSPIFSWIRNSGIVLESSLSWEQRGSVWEAATPEGHQRFSAACWDFPWAPAEPAGVSGIPALEQPLEPGGEGAFSSLPCTQTHTHTFTNLIWNILWSFFFQAVFLLPLSVTA